MILLGQRQGFSVEGQELPTGHPLHPDNKAGAFQKQIKILMKKKPKLKKKEPSLGDIVLPNTMVTTSKQPKGSYAV